MEVTNPDPELEDLMALVASQDRSEEFGPLPAQVVRYDAATQVCDAQVLVLVPVNGALKSVGIVRDVPVHWPSGAAWSMAGPMANGDLVWLEPAGADIGHWKASGSAESPQADLRRFHLSDMVARPGGRPLSNPLPSTALDASALVLACAMILLGSSQATDFVALASKVLTELGKIETAFNAHTHAISVPCSVDPVSHSGTAVGTSGPGPSYTKASVAATKVKAE